MAKRFTETTKWNEDWYLDLSIQHKLFWIYICDNCDYAGVYKPNKKLFQFCVGYDIKEIDFLQKINIGKKRIEVLKNGRWYLKGFIEFQYGKKLNPNSNVHKNIIKILNENNIKSDSYSLEGTKQESQPRTIQEVIDFFKEKGSNKSEGERFFYYYESQGWKVGKNQMKNWRMSASGWISRNKKDLPNSEYLEGQIKAIKG